MWITFRDAELKVMYPETEPRYYGSIHPMCVSIYLEKLTQDRIKTLKE
ncbi:lysozyme inhibitor LprI family protein [Nonlabens sp.]